VFDGTQIFMIFIIGYDLLLQQALKGRNPSARGEAPAENMKMWKCFCGASVWHQPMLLQQKTRLMRAFQSYIRKKT